ncbi:MAG: penicillin acylase family protein, partial [Bacteroidota bacterium]
IIDFAVQFLRVRELVEERYDRDVSPRFKKILEAYAQGANDYARAHPDELLVKNVLPVTTQDVLVGYCMSLVLIQGAHFHLGNILEGMPGAPTPNSLRGSNGFAFNSKRTADGQVYLANNSHQPLDGPTSWYEAHTVSEEGLNVLGGLFPGGVSIFAGANLDIAWMQTVNNPDLVDVYELESNPKNKLQYKYDGEWKTLEVRKAKMKVKLGPIKLKVSRKTYWSVHGPVIEGKKAAKGKFYAIRFSALHTIKAAEQWHTMGKARNYTQFRKALEMGGLPSLNCVYADRQDTIYYVCNGLYPIRKEGYDWRGLLPGNTSEVVWTEFHPYDEIPQVLNPPSGYVFNVNNTPYSCTAPEDNPKREDYSPTIINFPVENNRSLRFLELVEAEETVTWEDFKRIKYDQTYPDSVYIYFLTNGQKIFELPANEFPDIKEEIELLNNWDREADA